MLGQNKSSLNSYTLYEKVKSSSYWWLPNQVRLQSKFTNPRFSFGFEIKKETMISIHKKIFQYRMVRRNTSWEVSIGWSQDRTIAELIAKLEPTQYRNNICYNQKGKPILYIQLKKALYGMLQATLVFWNYCLWCNRSGGSRSMSTITALWTRQPLASNVQYYGMLTI